MYSHSCITSLISDTSNSLLGIKLAKLPAFICFLLSEFMSDSASSPSCLTCCLADVKWQEFAFNIILFKMYHNNNKNPQFQVNVFEFNRSLHFYLSLEIMMKAIK